jgi:hypothetical protein
VNNPAIAAILADAKAQLATITDIRARRLVCTKLILHLSDEAWALMQEEDRRNARAADAHETVRAIRESERRGRTA